jgi:hypothetical protein
MSDELNVTWSTKYLDPASGRECSIGVTNGDGKTVLAKAAEIVSWLDKIGAQPVLSGQAVASANASASAPMLPLQESERRLLITKVKRTGPTTVDLYAKGHQYRDTTLFDAGELLAVGIDPRALPEGTEVPARFYAVVVESRKLNKAGNPYLDVTRLERAQ